MTQDKNLGLRDRKRRETRARLEEAAITLVLRDGPELTTIDAISEMADVSPRTFFNYFESKDAAILGVRQLDVTEEVLAEHLAKHTGLDPVASVVRLILGLISSPLSRSTIQLDRMEIVRRHPQLISGQFTQMLQMAEHVGNAVQQVLAGYPQFAANDADLAARADVMFGLCSSGVRAAMKEWAAGAITAETDAEATRTHIEQRAIALVHEVTERLK